MQLADGDTPPATAPRRGPRRRRAAGSRALVRARRRSAPRGQRALPVGVRLTHSRDKPRCGAVEPSTQHADGTAPRHRCRRRRDRAVARRQLEPQLPRRLFGRVPRRRGARRAIERVDRDALPTRARTNAPSSRCTTASSSVSSTPCSTTTRSGAHSSTTCTSARTGSGGGSGVSWSRRPRGPWSTSAPAAASTSGCSRPTPAASAFYAERGGEEVERLEEEAVDGTRVDLLPRRLAQPDRPAPPGLARPRPPKKSSSEAISRRIPPPNSLLMTRRREWGANAANQRPVAVACGAASPRRRSRPPSPTASPRARSLQSPAQPAPQQVGAKKSVTCDTLTMRHLSPYCLI